MPARRQGRGWLDPDGDRGKGAAGAGDRPGAPAAVARPQPPRRQFCSIKRSRPPKKLLVPMAPREQRYRSVLPSLLKSPAATLKP